MISFDVVSDLHLDFYSYAHERQDKQKRAIINYVEKRFYRKENNRI